VLSLCARPTLASRRVEGFDECDMDPRAIKILCDTYWSPSGWRPFGSARFSGENFEYAKRAGVMFDPEVIDHDRLVRRAISARDQVGPREVANGFACSLRAGRPDWRSALGSYAFLRHFPDHPRPLPIPCTICGATCDGERTEDLSVLNFERIKWGGMRHCDPLYATLDLELFARSERPSPADADSSTLRALIDAIGNAPAKTTAAQLEKRFAKVFKSNKAQRDQIVSVLSIAGILEEREHPGFRKRFLPSSELRLPSRHFTDLGYPASWWTGSDGINEQALNEWFGHLL
jgi:hypothetical protein